MTYGLSRDDAGRFMNTYVQQGVFPEDPFHTLDVDGVAAVSFTVRNTGNLRLAATPTVAIDGPFGMGASELTLEAIPELLPGGEYSGTVVMEDVRAFGRLTGVLTLVPTTPVLGPIEVSTTTWAIPMRVVIIVLFVIVALLVRRRRSRHRSRVESAPAS